jgi:hypothetical protein
MVEKVIFCDSKIMNRLDTLDEAREALIDKLYLIYLYLIDAVGRTRTIGDSFDIENIYRKSMDAEALEKALREFEILCQESAKI